MRSDGLRPLPISASASDASATARSVGFSETSAQVDVAHSFPRGLLLADTSKAVLEKAGGRGGRWAKLVPRQCGGARVREQQSEASRDVSTLCTVVVTSRQTSQDTASGMHRARAVV